MTALHSRIGRLEHRLPDPALNRPPRILRLTTRQGREDEALQTAKAEGYDPDNDLIIMRVIVPSPGRGTEP